MISFIFHIFYNVNGINQQINQFKQCTQFHYSVKLRFGFNIVQKLLIFLNPIKRYK